MNIFAENAAMYAAQGLAVFPVSPRGKHPIIPGGCNAGTTDEAQIKEWCEIYPDANIGIACAQSGLVVLDVDKNKGGIESLKELYKDPALARALNNTRTIKTGTGGYHFWFKARPNVEIRNSVALDPNDNLLGAGIDVRGIGGLVVVPPSVNVDGNPYTIYNDVAPIELPLELVARLEKQVDRWTPVARSGQKIAEGGRNDWLMRIGCSLRAKGFSENGIFAALFAMNLEDCVPPLEEPEVRQIAGSCARYERGDALEEYKRMKRASNGQDDTKKGRRTLDMRTYSEIQEEKIDWLWAGRIAYAKFQLLVGLPGKTKSYLTLALAAAVSKGERLPGDYINLNPPPQDVLLVTYEDGEGDTIKPRLRKCGADMTRIHTINMDAKSFTTEDIPALHAVLEEKPQIRFVIIDPVQNMMGDVDGTSDERVRVALNPLVIMANRLKVAVLGIKHLNKNEKASIDNRVGGSIGYAGIARGILLAGHDNSKEYGPNNEVYAGVLLTKGNLAGRAHGILYEVNDNGLQWLGEDPTLCAERLLPASKKDKKE